MRKIVIGLAIVGALAFAGWQLVGGAAGVVDVALPAFPDYPPPAERLTAGAEGPPLLRLDHALRLRRPDRDLSHATPTSGRGTLFLPAEASPGSPAPAMVLLHGSGGISPGREMETAEWLASQGIAGFVVDYYDPRGVTPETNYMLRVLSITEFGRGGRRLWRAPPALVPPGPRPRAHRRDGVLVRRHGDAARHGRARAARAGARPPGLRGPRRRLRPLLPGLGHPRDERGPAPDPPRHRGRLQRPGRLRRARGRAAGTGNPGDGPRLRRRRPRLGGRRPARARPRPTWRAARSPTTRRATRTSRAATSRSIRPAHREPSD